MVQRKLIAPSSDEIATRWSERIQRSCPDPGEKAFSESGGVMFLSFEATKPYIGDRMARCIREVFEQEPLTFRVQPNTTGWGGLMFVVGDRPAIATENVAEYLFQRYLVSPRTLFAGVERLPPGHAATYDRIELRAGRYWQLDVPEDPVDLGPAELRDLLQAATARRLMSDVPIGVLLSGGVDSTAVLALAKGLG